MLQTFILFNHFAAAVFGKLYVCIDSVCECRMLPLLRFIRSWSLLSYFFLVITTCVSRISALRASDDGKRNNASIAR